MADAKKEPEIGSPAWQRADYARALEEELAAVKSQGKSEERVKAVAAELARAKREPRNRRDAKKQDA